MDDREFAENCNYWKTSKSSPDAWVEKSISLIEQFGGEIISSGFGNEVAVQRSAYMIRFKVEDLIYKIIWPVLLSEKGDQMAARRQAATMLYHDIKAKCVSAQVLGARVSFFSWMELPNGQPAFTATNIELLDSVPQRLLT